MSRPDRSTLNHRQSGLTMVELMVAMVVSSAVVAAAYGSYMMVSNQYDKVVEISEMHGAGRTVLDLMSRDLRMTGYHDYCMNSIEQPIRIENLAGSNTEQITIQFDEGPALTNNCTLQEPQIDRIRISYFACDRPVSPCRATGPYNLYRTKEVLIGAFWSSTQGSCAPGGRQAPCYSGQNAALIADNVDDLQFNYDVGAGYVVDISLVRRSKQEYGNSVKPFPRKRGRDYVNLRTETKNLGASDKFMRDEFFSSVVLRNLVASDLTRVPIFNAIETAISFGGGCGGSNEELFAFSADGSNTIGKLCCGRRTRIDCAATSGALANAYNRHLRVLNIPQALGRVVALGGTGADAQIQVQAINAKGGWTTKNYFPQR
ncbi:MAG TPA: prepilin-type N-terminal cleavage/methylation domain-containing protein [Arenicellales bacterium]|nr:prepilin-type N-terminal cleavage/methylation domain-containing protein [Arenicellales bacterium]